MSASGRSSRRPGISGGRAHPGRCRASQALAEEAEQHAASYYEALAGETSGEVQIFFLAMAQQEANHVSHIEELVDEAAA